MHGFPERYVILDTETTETVVHGGPPTRELTLRLGYCLITDGAETGDWRESEMPFTTSSEFHERIKMMPYSKETIYVFAHNMGFDARIVEWMRHVSLGSYSLLPPVPVPGQNRHRQPLFVAESPPFIVRLWRADGQQILLLDSYQWLGKSLRDVGELIGVPKSEMPPQDSSDADLMTYCRQDCVVLKSAMLRLWGLLQSCRMDWFSPTPAAQAMQLYKLRFERKRIIRPENPDVFKLDRAAYYGGRVECFRLGIFETPVFQLDVTSLYPYVMRVNNYPCEVLEVSDESHVSEEVGSFDPRCTTAEVWLETADSTYPIRGVDETLYCRGHVRTILCGPELEFAVQSGHVRKIGRHVRYRLDDLFSPYVRYLWDMRLEAKKRGDRFSDHIYKTLLARLHGKFGQKAGDWEWESYDYPRNLYCTGAAIGAGIEHDTEVRILAGHMYKRVRDREDPRGFVPIAAWTASYGRVHMDMLRNVAGEDHVYYQATDSLLVDGEGMGQLQLAGMVKPNALGYMRHEETHEWLAINGLHNLTTDKRHVRPGVRKGAVEVANETWEQDQWMGFSESIYRGKVSSTSISRTLKRTPGGCTRRRFVADGASEPWTIDNWEIPPEVQRLHPVRNPNASGK